MSSGSHPKILRQILDHKISPFRWDSVCPSFRFYATVGKNADSTGHGFASDEASREIAAH